MSEPDPDEKVWRDIAIKVAALFGLATGRSPTLRDTINRGVRFANIDGGEIVFDSNALLLGMLIAGEPDPSGIDYGNSALWLREWIVAEAGGAPLAGILGKVPDRSNELETLNQGPVVLSASVNDLVRLAKGISQLTAGREGFEARHFLAAMVNKGTIARQLHLRFGLQLDSAKLDQLKRYLIDRFLEVPVSGETRAKWLAAFRLPPEADTDDQEDGPTTPVEGITPFRNDGIGRDDGGEDDEDDERDDEDHAGRFDPLNTGDDVNALADLICLRQSTPLAVAIFGGWGSGKSTFMQALDGRIRELAKRWRKRIAKGEASPFVTRIVHIRFNAWQFVDANLWASLTAEFFDQLRAGGWKRAGKVRHAGLVERVNSHVHSLSTDAESRRQAAIRGGEGVRKAQKARDDAAGEAATAEGKAFAQATVDALGEIYEAQKANLSALGLATAGVDSGKSIDAVIDVVRSSRTILEQAGAVVRLLGKSRRRVWTAGVSMVVALGFLGLLAWLFLSGRIGPVQIVAAFGALSALGTFAAALAPALRMVAGIARRGGDIARAIDAHDEAAVRTLMHKEIELRDATAEAQALEQAAARADRALARYIDPDGAANPPRLLRYVLEDDPDTKAFEKEIGLIGRARRLFEAVDEIICVEAHKAPGETIDLEVPERIVLYIDDLDRCTEEQVYNVLQAIHLLLAFQSFAVVVGVDVRWIENALASEFTAEKAPALTDIERRQHAVHYLEKIFQVAFWLDPLSADGDDGGSFANFVRDQTKPVPSPQQDSAEGEGASNGGGDVGDPAPPDSETREEEEAEEAEGPGDEAEETGETGEAPGTPADEPAAEPLQTIELEQPEIDFLASAEIAALAGPTPRAVKHLVNVYRLVRSRLVRSGGAPMGFGAMPADYPLIALCVAVETGQPVEVADEFLESLKSTLPAGPLYSGPVLEEDSEPTAAPTLFGVLAKSAALDAALKRAYRLRGGDLTAGDALKIARLARRYSFNRYR